MTLVQLALLVLMSVMSVPTGDEIYVGARYDPHILYDFRGAGFRLVHNKLVQHDVRDIDDNLIPPWKAYEELRTGTVVLMEATIHCFRFNVNGRRERKVCGSLFWS